MGGGGGGGHFGRSPRPYYLPSDPATWSTAEVIRWLKEKGLNDFKDIMYSNGFEGKAVLDLKPVQFRVWAGATLRGCNRCCNMHRPF